MDRNGCSRKSSRSILDCSSSYVIEVMSVAGDAQENQRQSHEYLQESQQSVRRLSEVQQEVQVQQVANREEVEILSRELSLAEASHHQNLHTTSRSGASESSSEILQLRQERDHLNVHDRNLETETPRCRSADSRSRRQILDRSADEAAQSRSRCNGFGSRIRLQQRVTACQSISKVLSVISRQHLQVRPLERLERMVKDSASKKKEAEKLDFEAWPTWVNIFRIWRINFRSEDSSSASRPTEAMVWINEIESAKSVADQTTSHTITRAKLQTNIKVLDSKNRVGSRRPLNGDFKRRFFVEGEAAQIVRNTTSKASIWRCCSQGQE